MSGTETVNQFFFWYWCWLIVVNLCLLECCNIFLFIRRQCTHVVNDHQNDEEYFFNKQVSYHFYILNITIRMTQAYCQQFMSFGNIYSLRSRLKMTTMGPALIKKIVNI